MAKTRGSSPSVSTPEKAAISRHYQQGLFINKRGAATRTAAKFGIGGSGGASRAKAYDTEIIKMDANRTYRGKASGFSEAFEEAIDTAFVDDSKQTYKEAAAKMGLPKTTLYRYSTKNMDIKAVTGSLRPLVSDVQRAKRVKMGKAIVKIEGPRKERVSPKRESTLYDVYCAWSVLLKGHGGLWWSPAYPNVPWV